MSSRLGVLGFAITIAACSAQREPEPLDASEVTNIALSHDHCGAPKCTTGTTLVDLDAKRLTIRGCPTSGVPFEPDGGAEQIKKVRVERAMTEAEVARIRAALEGIRVGPANAGSDGEMWTVSLYRGEEQLGSHVYPAAYCYPGGATQVVAGFSALRDAVPTE